jgi:hypothetical protein
MGTEENQEFVVYFKLPYQNLHVNREIHENVYGAGVQLENRARKLLNTKQEPAWLLLKLQRALPSPVAYSFYIKCYNDASLMAQEYVYRVCACISNTVSLVCKGNALHSA